MAPLRFEEPDSPAFSLPKNRLWLHVLLLVMTLFTTTLVGAHMQYNFTHNLPFFDVENYLDIFTLGLRSLALFLSGLPFSLTLLTILMAHEMGHYLACSTTAWMPPCPSSCPGLLRYTARSAPSFASARQSSASACCSISASRARWPASCFSVPALGVGLAFSKVIPGINHEGITQLGVPALQWILERTVFPGIPSADIYLHPVARAAWVGMFATALNLLPAGQLDGGHIVYALLGRSHKWITLSLVFRAAAPWLSVAGMVVLGCAAVLLCAQASARL